MKKTLFFLLLTLCSLQLWAYASVTLDTDAIWQEFRNNHPYGYQTVGLKHIGDDCVFVISEPSEKVSKQSIQGLFEEYGGTIDIMQQSLGYDGWMKDVVGSVHFADDYAFASFQKKLFVLLYGTDYKAYYTNLDNPNYHAYYSPYKLNYSVSAAEISKWIIDDKEVFVSPDGKETTIPQALSGSVNGAGQLLESRSSGFVAWIICPNELQEGDKGFLINARKFSIDTDLILGAFGNKGKNVAIIARKRMVPVDILPPLRLETIELLCTTRNKNLAQSYERYHVFAGKTESQKDVAPIYLSDELWNTEYGNLLNVTDQMLKSWSMNGAVDYTNFEYPKPMDWAFEGSVIQELDVSTLTFNWNTSGAGYVIEGDGGLDIFAVNRTGSLPVSYIPEGAEGTDLGNKIYEAEELAYDFFSNLNNPDLTRVVQYATLYQIFCHFRNVNGDDSGPSNFNFDAPSYQAHETVIEKLLHLVDNKADSGAAIEEGYNRFAVKARKSSVGQQLRTFLEKDPYGEFKQFLIDQESEEYIDSLLNISSKDEDIAIRRQFDSYLEPNLQIVKDYIGNYKDKYKDFPYGMAAHYIVCPRSFNLELKNNADWLAYQSAVDKYNNDVEELRRHKEDLRIKIDQYNAAVKRGTATSATRNALSIEQLDVLSEEIAISNRYKVLEKNKQTINAQLDKTKSLIASTEQSKAIGALNWLLTDPGEYNEPIGDFFAHLFKNNGATWLKCPTIASSWVEGAYGGHNLDAHVTPIKVSAGIPAGKCRVSNIDGHHVISASKQDLRRITPSVLRDIERKNLSGLVDLPELPELRKTNYALSSNGPHFDNNNNFVSNMVPVREKGVVLKEKECRTMDDVVEAWGGKGKEICRHIVKMYEYSEREVSVSFDNGPEHVLDRSKLFSFELSNYDIERMEVQELPDGNVRLSIAQKEETIKAPNCTKASFGIEIPREYVEKAKDIMLRTYASLKDKTTNLFRFKKGVENDLQMNGVVPCFSTEAIMIEIGSTDISIINIEEDEVIFLVAA